MPRLHSCKFSRSKINHYLIILEPSLSLGAQTQGPGGDRRELEEEDSVGGQREG